MYLKKLIIKNFRIFDEIGIELIFNKDVINMLCDFLVFWFYMFEGCYVVLAALNFIK